jgi:hypothetical protein
MTGISEHIAASDPVSYPELLRLSSDPVFDELFQAVVTGDDSVQSLPAGRDERPELVAASPVRRVQRRRLIIALASSAAAAVLLIAAIAAFGLQALHPNHRAAAAHGRQSTGLQGGAPAWHLVGYLSPSWRTQPSAGMQFGLSLTCPDTNTCYAVDFLADTQGGLEVSHDGGNTWQQLGLPVMLVKATPPACLNAEDCAILGVESSGRSALLETADGGQSWTASPGPSGLTSADSLIDLSCVSKASCVAVALDRSGPPWPSIAYSTNDTGGTWTEARLPQGFVPSRLQCDGSSMCVAAGRAGSPNDGTGSPPGMVIYSTDGGLTWKTASLPATVGPLARLSCASASDCLASFFNPANPFRMTNSVLVSTDGGQSWTQAATAPQSFITGLSCPSASQCWASGLLARRNSGGSGQSVSVFLNGGLISYTSNGGSTWQRSQLPAGIGLVADISCPAESNCYAIAIQRTRSEPYRRVRDVLLAYGS